MSRDDAPAIIMRDPATGEVVYEAWYKNDKRDRVDGPATINRDPKTGAIIYEEWWDRDRLHRDDGPAHIERYTTGEVIREIWCKNGKPIKSGTATD